MESPSSWKIVKLVFLRKLEPEKWKNLHVGGVDGISCQHLQVMVSNLLQKHWERQEERNPVMRHGTVVRPTMYLASLDIKTAFNEAKPKHVAHILDGHNTHGWLIVALLREMWGWEAWPRLNAWKAALVSTEACDKEAWKPHPRLWQKMATQIWANVEEKWMRKRSGILLDFGWEGIHQIGSFMCLCIMSHSKENLEQMLRDVIEETRTQPNVSVVDEYVWCRREEWHEFGHHIGMLRISFKILGCAMNRQGKTYDAVEERMQSANKAFWEGHSDLQ